MRLFCFVLFFFIADRRMRVSFRNITRSAVLCSSYKITTAPSPIQRQCIVRQHTENITVCSIVLYILYMLLVYYVHYIYVVIMWQCLYVYNLWLPSEEQPSSGRTHSNTYESILNFIKYAIVYVLHTHTHTIQSLRRKSALHAKCQMRRSTND